jgi:hypothetical protein
MSLFDAPAPPNITATTTTAATAPQYLTDYLTNLASAGTSALGTVSDGKLTPFTGSQMIANLPTNLQNLYKDAPGTLERYQTPLDEALTAGQAGAEGIGATDISAFYNPYEADVVNKLSEQSAENVQRGLLPALRGAFAGQGAFGSRRYAGALGQALADVERDVLGQQGKLKYEGYKAALDAALRQKGLQTQAAQALTSLGQAEAQGAQTGLKTLADIGAQELAYEQSKMEAPLTRAQNVAQILRGYTYPTTSTETYVGPSKTGYGLSPLQQIAGLGTLVGSAFGSKDAAGNKLINWLGKFGESLPDVSGYGTTGINPIYGGVDTDGTMSTLEAYGGL